jgi:spermidine synthase
MREYVSALGDLRDESSIPTLKAMLLAGPQVASKTGGRKYLIADAAARALRSLGLTVEGDRDKGGYRVVEGPQKTADHTVLFRTKSLFGDLEVTEANGIRYLFVDGVLQTAMYADRARITKECYLPDKHYWLELLPYFHPEGKRCLLIGLGGGLLPAVLEGYGIETHGVEIDEKVLEVARTYFGYKQEASVCDGREFLVRSTDRYDFVVIDAFEGAELPAHLASKECFELAKQRLLPSGILALNLISRPSGSRVSASIVRTLNEVFPYVEVYRTESTDRVQSLICFASMKPLKLSLHPHGGDLGMTAQSLEKIGEFKVKPTSPTSVVLTDGENPLKDEWSKESGEWQKRLIKLFGQREKLSREE